MIFFKICPLITKLFGVFFPRFAPPSFLLALPTSGRITHCVRQLPAYHHQHPEAFGTRCPLLHQLSSWVRLLQMKCSIFWKIFGFEVFRIQSFAALLFNHINLHLIVFSNRQMRSQIVRKCISRSRGRSLPAFPSFQKKTPL